MKIETNSDSAMSFLKKVEVESGTWTDYGNDGRSTILEVSDQFSQQVDGFGFKARFIENPHGGDYGWGPLAQTYEGAVALFLAEHLAGKEDGESE
jgi:hypothetical protein